MNRLRIALIFVSVSLFVESASAQGEDAFETKARLSKDLGVSVVTITDDLPPALWQYDVKDDPYPGWYIYRPGLLKIFPPKSVRPSVNASYADKVADILGRRCAVLRKYGLKANFNSNEPQTMPEAFFTAYPQLRGPRVDQPNRSRAARWAPSVDEPATLSLYAEAMKAFVQRCPEIESVTLLTSDSGSGFDWVPALYAGLNGNSKWKDRPMELRVSGFLIALQQAAKEQGADIKISLMPIAPRQWMTPSFSPQVLDAIIAKLPRGIAVSGREGPDGRPFERMASPGAFGGSLGPFAPVAGIVVPDVAGGQSLIELGDPTVMDFNYRMMKALRGRGGPVARLEALHAFATEEVGAENADELLEVWSSLNQVQQRLDVLNFGAMLQFGHVLNRWIDRPMVPFPQELTPAETRDWRPFLFQAKGDQEANNLIDIQAMRMFEGWGAKLIVQRAIETTAPQVLAASQRIARLAPSIPDPGRRAYWQLYAVRLEAVYCLLQSADHMVSYQAHLDRVHALGLEPEADPPLATGSDWARTEMMELARKEIDTMVRLEEILQSTKEPVLESTARPDEETAMRLGPDIARKIKDKIDTMNRHWRDYDRIFTSPNL